MHVNTQISRGLERIMASNAGAYLEGMYGLSGFGACQSFGELEDLSAEAGVPGSAGAVRKLRRAHACACRRMREALPVAVAVKEALEETNGPAPLPMSEQAATLGEIAQLHAEACGLGATSAAKLQKKITKTEKKLAKAAAKEAKHDAKIAAKVAKLQAKGQTAKVQKVLAKEGKHDTKIAAKALKRQGVIEAARSAISAMQTPAVPVTPTAAAAAVLASQAQLPPTPAVQQVAQEVVANAAQPGSTIPEASLNVAPTSFAPAAPGPALSFDAAAPAETAPVEEGGGLFGNVSPVALAGGAAVLAFLLFGKKRG